MVTSKPISSKPAFVRLAFPMYEGGTSDGVNIFDITDHLVSFDYTILEDTNSTTARQFIISLINPSDNVEKVILNQYENFVPSIGSADKSADVPILPIALIEFGYGSDLEDGKSKIHAAMMTNVEYIFTAGKEKSLRITLYSVEHLARRGHASLGHLYSTQLYKKKGSITPQSTIGGTDLATALDEANFNLEIKSMSEIVTDLILTVLNDCGNFVEFEDADINLGTYFSNRLNRFNSMRESSDNNVNSKQVKTLKNSFKKIGDTGATDFLAVKRFCETVGLKLVIKGLDLDQGRNLTATKSQGTPGVATEDPSPDQDEAGSSDELSTGQVLDVTDLIHSVPFLKADFMEAPNTGNFLDETRYNVSGYIKVTPLMAGNLPQENGVFWGSPQSVYYFENFAPAADNQTPGWPVLKGDESVLQMLTPEGTQKLHDFCLNISQAAVQGEADALEDIEPPVTPEITPPERSDLKPTINLAAAQVSLEIPEGHDALEALDRFIARIGATFSHYTGPVPKVRTIAKSLLNTRALSLPLISFSDIRDWARDNYKVKVFVLPRADLHKRLKTPSSNEEKRIRSFPHLHQDNTEDYNEIVLEYGASDSIIKTFTWDGDLSFLLANIGSQPAPITLEELDDYGTLLQKRPLRFLAIALSDEIEFQGTDAASDMDFAFNDTEGTFNETFSPYHGIWDTAAKISRIGITDAMVKRLTEFVTRVTETNDMFQHHISRISQTHGADAENAVKVLVDTFLRAEKARAAFNIPTPKPPSLTEKWLGPNVISWVNKFRKRMPVMFNSEDDTLQVTSDYILNKVGSSMYAFQLNLNTLGIPELDSVEDLLGTNDRVIKLLIHDISKEKTSKGVPVYHWLSGKYVLQGITHSIGLKGYQSSLHLIRLPYTYPEHPLTIGEIS
jgi:hypothetical protein